MFGFLLLTRDFKVVEQGKRGAGIVFSWNIIRLRSMAGSSPALYNAYTY
jgi:hypothetical protein